MAVHPTVLRAPAILLGLFTFGSTVASAQEAATIARLQPDKIVELLDLQKGQWHRVYGSPTWGLTDLTVAPDGNRLALLSWTEGVVSGVDYSVPPTPELVVIDTLGRKLAAVPRAHRHAWCGPGCIVYITGEYREDGHHGFRPDGVGVLDVATGVRTPLPSPPYPIGVTWRRHDGAAYLKNASGTGEPRIYRLDLERRTIRPTDLLDHDFSPSGRFYIDRPPESGTVLVRRTADNAEVPLVELRRGADLVGWAGGDRDLLLAVKHEPRPPGSTSGPPYAVVRPMNPVLTYLLYDLDRQQVVQSQRGRLTASQSQQHQPLLELSSGWRILQ